MYYFPITYTGMEYSALLSHVKSIDVKRLRMIISSISHSQFRLIKQAYIETINI